MTDYSERISQIKDRTEFRGVALWHKDRLYDIVVKYDDILKINVPFITRGSRKIIIGPSLIIPGPKLSYSKFECPKCLELHKFPDTQGGLLICQCGRWWKFWGSGVAEVADMALVDEVFSFILEQNISGISMFD